MEESSKYHQMLIEIVILHLGLSNVLLLSLFYPFIPFAFFKTPMFPKCI